MKCPNENAEMRQITVESHYGRTAVLDQCEKCGGIWFDKLELYMVRQGQAAKIELLDSEALYALSVIENPELRCPKDNARLVQFKDGYFPADIIILRCSLCDGFWLNRGEFNKYKKFRQKLQHRDEIVIDDIQGQNAGLTPSQYQPVESEDVLGRLSKFLSTPIDQNNLQLIKSSKSSPEEQESVNAILDVLTVILKMLIHR
jgi:Zn-finger nucleic acid-binding protein